MNTPLVVMDVGDVVVRTVPMAHYRTLGRRTGLAWEHVADHLEGSGAIAAFECGRLTAAGFVEAVRRSLSVPDLSTDQVEEAWNAVVAEPEPVLVPTASRLAAAGRLLLASNTNPFHWRIVHRRLANVGISARACLSFDVGCVKPSPRFFAALRVAAPSSHVVYVDDRRENVQAASTLGWIGWVHREPTATVDYLHDLLD